MSLTSLLCWILLILKTCCYIIDEHTQCSNVEGATNTPYVTYLGKFNTTQECINQCIAKSCDSYTFYLPNINPSNTSGQCWSYINNTMWLPYSTSQSDCGRIIYPCNSDYDCSLNGQCDIKTGNCTCRIGWNGYKCHYLSLTPANRSAGYLSPFGSYNQTSWLSICNINVCTYILYNIVNDISITGEEQLLMINMEINMLCW